jgi:23S rRNA maturation mini-RNase III
MFRHPSAILWESTNTKTHKSSTPLQVLIALIFVSRVSNVKILEDMRSTNTKTHKSSTLLQVLIALIFVSRVSNVKILEDMK